MESQGPRSKELFPRGLGGRAGEAVVDPEMQRRTANIRRLAPIASLVSLVTLSAYAFLYSQLGALEMLASAAAILAVGVASGIVVLWLRASHVDRAAYLLIVTLALLLPANELLLAGATLPVALSAVALTVMTSVLVLPRRQLVWAAVAGLSAAGLTLLIDRVVPWPRFDVAQPDLLRVLGPVLVAGVGLLVLWFAARAVRAGTMRNRLSFAFMLVGVLPVVILGLFSAFAGWQSSRRQAIRQLELAALVKEARINAWVDGIESTLDELARKMGTEAADTDRTSGYGILEQRLAEQAERMGPDGELFLVDLEGAMVFSTAGTAGRTYGDQVLFRRGLTGPFTEATFCTETLAPPQLVSVRPVLAANGDVLGVIGGRVGISGLRDILSDPTGLGETGESYLVGPGLAACTDLRLGEERASVTSLGAQRAVVEMASGSGTYDNYAGLPVVGAYRWLPKLDLALLAEQAQREAFAATYTLMAINGSVVLLSILIAVVTSLSVTREITDPLTDLTSVAGEIANGEWAAVAEVSSDDEFGVLARAFNTMASQLRELIGRLEQTLADRTRDLERHSRYLQAASEAGRAATSMMAEDRLIDQLVELIRDRFELYYVGLFVLDQGDEWLVLRAATGRTGRELVAKGHRIRVGEGMAGWSVAHARPRTATGADQGTGVLKAEGLSVSRSEAALPLRSRGRAIGVLTLYSDRPGTFDQEAMAVLQIVADQVAAALDNARLFAESAQRVEAARRAYRDLSRAEWARWLYARPGIGFRSDAQGVTRVSEAWDPQATSALEAGQAVQMKDDGSRSRLAVPIRVRGSVIGVLETHKPASEGAWTSQEVALLERILEQLELALDNARLYEDAQRLVIRERQLREIGAHMQSSVSVGEVLQVAVEELAKTLNVPLTFVQLTPGALRTPPD